MRDTDSYYKYPSTPHLPWSPCVNDDDVLLNSTQGFEGEYVVVTEKLDGESTSMYTDHIHARSIDSNNHPSRDWVKAYHARIKYLIPKMWRVCGENVYAEHSLVYDDLKSYFYIFSVWNNNNMCLNWDDTVEFASKLNFPVPKVLYEGIWDEEIIRAISLDTEVMEGFVVRNKKEFPYSEFDKNIAKWVRKNHVQTDKHWMRKEVVPNKLWSEK